MIRLQTIRSRTILIALAAMAGTALPVHAWGDRKVIDPAKGYVWTGDPCMPRWQRPEIRVITEADYTAAIDDIMRYWQADFRDTLAKIDPDTDAVDQRAVYYNAEVFQLAATEVEARKNARAWLSQTIYPPYTHVYCPENITHILAWAEQRDAETFRRLNPPDATSSGKE